MDALVCQELGLETSPADMSEWEAVIQRIIKPQHQVRIGVIGKYIHLQDAYKSVYEAVTHAGGANDCAIEIVRVDSEDIERDGAAAHLADMDGILVPGGFGERGVEGKVLAAQYARENNVPYLGLCLGMQIACIEFARHALGLDGRTRRSLTPRRPTPSSLCSTNSKTSPTWRNHAPRRAGLCAHARSKAAELYGTEEINERHRHRYEFNNAYREQFEAQDFVFSGTSPDGNLVELIELKNHPYFMATQAHPEFKSKPVQAHPLFAGFIKAAHERANGN